MPAPRPGAGTSVTGTVASSRCVGRSGPPGVRRGARGAWPLGRASLVSRSEATPAGLLEQLLELAPRAPAGRRGSLSANSSCMARGGGERVLAPSRACCSGGCRGVAAIQLRLAPWGDEIGDEVLQRRVGGCPRYTGRRICCRRRRADRLLAGGEARGLDNRGYHRLSRPAEGGGPAPHVRRGDGSLTRSRPLVDLLLCWLGRPSPAPNDGSRRTAPPP